MSPVQAVLKPGDVLAVRTGGLFARLIRIGEELSGAPGLDNHVAVMHHWAGDVPWMIEGRPGGVGWADGRAYTASAYSVNNCGQPGRGDAQRAEVAKLAEYMIGTAYSWESITDDTLRAFHMPDLFASTFRGVVPAHVVCSSFSALLYERAGWERPPVADRDTMPSDWVSFALGHGWSVKLEALPLALQPKAGESVLNVTDNLLWELQDQVQRVERKVDRLCHVHGIDPDKAGELPGEPVPEGTAA